MKRDTDRKKRQPIEPDKVFASQSVWRNDELVETLDDSARAHRTLRRKNKTQQIPPTSTVSESTSTS